MEVRLLKPGPVPVKLVRIGDEEYATPAVVSASGRGRHVIPGLRVTIVPGEGAEERWERKIAKRTLGARIAETVVDASISRAEPRGIKLLARHVAEECPEDLYCLPPVVVGARENLDAIYEAILEGFEAGGGDACSAPLYEASVLREILKSCGKSVVVLDAGRRAWSRLLEGLRSLESLKDNSLVYLVNAYRGGGLPRPARELAFFIHGADVLGFSRPTLRQLAVIKRSSRGEKSGGSVQSYGLDPRTLEYRLGAPPLEEVVEEFFGRLEELEARSLEELLEELCGGGCEWLLSEVMVQSHPA